MIKPPIIPPAWDVIPPEERSGLEPTCDPGSPKLEDMPFCEGWRDGCGERADAARGAKGTVAPRRRDDDSDSDADGVGVCEI